MEKKLKKLFDYQKFSNNELLNEAIKEVQLEEAILLDDEQLFAAAGGADRRMDREDNDKKQN